MNYVSFKSKVLILRGIDKLVREAKTVLTEMTLMGIISGETLFASLVNRVLC